MFKKILVFSCIAALSYATVAVAATNETDPGQPFSVTDGTNAMSFSFSPSVAGQYLTAGATNTEQAFTIGTYHSGGTLFYGTSSDQTITWKKDRATTTQTFADAGFPSTVTAEDGTETETGTTTPWNEADSGWFK